MNTYQMKFSRFFGWRTVTLIGHHYEASSDKMVLYHADKSVEEIPGWNKYHVKYGPDLIDAIKKGAEAKAGQAIPLNG